MDFLSLAQWAHFFLHPPVGDSSLRNSQGLPFGQLVPPSGIWGVYIGDPTPCLTLECFPQMGGQVPLVLLGILLCSHLSFQAFFVPLEVFFMIFHDFCKKVS